MLMEKTWRWYGPNDPITLADIRQTGATGIVTALHHVPIGEVWTKEEVAERIRIIEADNHGTSQLRWSVIESIPVHEDIKLGKPNRDEWIEKYKESIKNVGEAGINTICYNFMPVIDWTRTNLSRRLDNGARALDFNIVDVAVFDIYMINRENAKSDYPEEIQQAAEAQYKNMSDEEKATLQHNIIAGLPGGQEGYDIEKFKARLDAYNEISIDQYRENLKYFLEGVIPTAIEAGVRLAIHPDDPPYQLFGLPRIVSTEEDLKYLLSVVDSVANGYTMCTGSYGVRADNDLAGMVERYGDKLNFVHLRSVQRYGYMGFYEADHLEGDVDMFAVITAVLKEQKKREEAGRKDVQLPMRPDHGHVLLDDQSKKTNPGYSAIGRLKGLAALSGIEQAIVKSGLV